MRINLVTFLWLFFVNNFLWSQVNTNDYRLSIKKTRNQILILTSIITGVITAFAGPIAFIGLAVDNLIRTWANRRKKLLGLEEY